MRACVRACVCVRACASVRVCVCVCTRARLCARDCVGEEVLRVKNKKRERKRSDVQITVSVYPPGPLQHKLPIG